VGAVVGVGMETDAGGGFGGCSSATTGADRLYFSIVKISCMRFVSSRTYDSIAAARNWRFSSDIGIAVDGPLVPSDCARLHFNSALYIGIFSIVSVIVRNY